jgi:hypothetical protein
MPAATTKKDGAVSGRAEEVCECCGRRQVCYTYMDDTEKWCACGRYYYKRAWEVE